MFLVAAAAVRVAASAATAASVRATEIATQLVEPSQTDETINNPSPHHRRSAKNFSN